MIRPISKLTFAFSIAALLSFPMQSPIITMALGGIAAVLAVTNLVTGRKDNES